MNGRAFVLVSAIVIAGLVVLASAAQPIVLAALVLLSAGATGIVLIMTQRASVPHEEKRAVGLPKGHRWIAVSWFLMLLVSEQRFTTNRSPLDANSGSVSAEILVELLVYGLTALAIIRHWEPARGTASAPRDVRPLFAWVFLSILSTSWSVVPLFSFVRGMELIVPPLLAIHSARVIRSQRDGGKALVRATFRLFIFGLAVLCAIGWVTPWPYDGNRFAWQGTHPLVVSNLLGLALIALVIAGKRVLGFPWWVRLPLIAYFGITLVYCQPRTDYVAIGFAALTGLWFAGRYRLGYRTIGLLYYLAGAGVFFAIVKGQIFNIASHGGGYQNAATFNGRTTLWQLALQDTHTIKDWLVGQGYGSPRVKIYSQAAWSGSAHSSPIELLLGIGLIGLLLFLWELVFVGHGLASKSRTTHLDSRVQVLAITLFAFVIVHGIVSSELVVPSSSCTMISFLASFVVARRATRPEDAPTFVGSRVSVAPPTDEERDAFALPPLW
ncbi:MAG: hypothetical protein JO086_04860 [Acidimicrobiia bacterium]|nr:hypothetical protein [Acidimicrobiia bacterium]